ncbi:MAG: ferrous iron transport protein B [Ruminococcus sp.]|jgi:ferrous iron transport protein B
MEFFHNLTHMEPGQSAVIDSISLPVPSRRRVQELGIIPGTEITCLYTAPSGDPMAFSVCGTVIAIRREDAQMISIVSLSSRKTIALAGNPNVGKSTLFNQLTGLNQHVGNWPGKTVESVTGICHFHGTEYEFTDLPGTYSLFSRSREEEVTGEFLSFGYFDLVVIICDGGCLQRNLILALQILEITSHVILCINMMDEVKRRKITIDLPRLQQMLGIPVIGITARRKKDREKLLSEIERCLQNENFPSDSALIHYPNPLVQSLQNIQAFFRENTPSLFLPRWTALQLLDSPDTFLPVIEAHLSMPSSFWDDLKIKLQREALELKNHLSSHWKDSLSCAIVRTAGEIADATVVMPREKSRRQSALDRLFTRKQTAFPIMLLGLFLILWLTIFGANIPSAWLSQGMTFLGQMLADTFSSWGIPDFLNSLLTDGIYRTTAWVVSVMLPPMAIFFPLFTLLEDFGYLPRVSFNLDHQFEKCRTCGKQALTMAMGLGCNAVGVTGCRIIDSPKERLIAILTNSLMPCNGRFPTLILMATLLLGCTGNGMLSSVKTAFLLVLCICFSVFMTFLVSALLSKIIKKENHSSFFLELPPYRKPQFGKVILRSILDRTVFVLGRAVAVAAPAGLLIWILANVCPGGHSLLYYISAFLDLPGRLMGLDGVILLAFILGFPANEIILPIMLMIYMNQNQLTELGSISQLGPLLLSQGWSPVTVLCFLVFLLMHWPCSTTCLTIKKETGSLCWTAAAVLLPALCGIILCLVISAVSHLFYL